MCERCVWSGPWSASDFIRSDTIEHELRSGPNIRCAVRTESADLPCDVLPGGTIGQVM